MTRGIFVPGAVGFVTRSPCSVSFLPKTIVFAAFPSMPVGATLAVARRQALRFHIGSGEIVGLYRVGARQGRPYGELRYILQITSTPRRGGS